MEINELKPSQNLTPYIDAYWELKSIADFTVFDKVIPDGCVDLIINLGDDYIIASEKCTLKSERAYLGGALTEVKENVIVPKSHLLGIRFKAAAFSNFYSFSSLHETTNYCVELDRSMFPDMKSISTCFYDTFNKFYTDKFIQPKHHLLPVIDSVEKLKGNVSVHELAKINCTTVRQLERAFSHHIGLSPKEYINIIRFKFAKKLIQSNYPGNTLLDIALQCGYYDGAHLSNEIKKYAGTTPSQL